MSESINYNSVAAKEKQPTIIFIDEIDAIGTKRFDSEKAGDREVQRTMLELLSQLDGFMVNILRVWKHSTFYLWIKKNGGTGV